MCKQFWLDWAEVIDSCRIVPRLVLFGYGIWAVRTTDWLIHWYIGLSAADRTAQVTAFITIVLPGIYGLATVVYKIYSNGGRNWDEGIQQQQNPPVSLKVG